MNTQRFNLINDQVRQNAVDAVSIAPPGYQVTIGPAKNKRSLAQNALLHLWMREVSQQYAEATGEFHAPDVWKEYFKRMHLGQETIRGMDVTRSTAKLTVKEMADFLTWIDHYCGSELEIQLPRPLDMYMEAFK